MDFLFLLLIAGYPALRLRGKCYPRQCYPEVLHVNRTGLTP